MSAYMTNPRRRQRLSALADKEYRDAYVDEHIKQGIAFQIRATREARGWTQEELAEQTGQRQPVISQLENPDYGGYTLKTLKRLASAFDVALVVRFVPFSYFIESTFNIQSSDLAPARFTEDAGLAIPRLDAVCTSAPRWMDSSETRPTYVDQPNAALTRTTIFTDTDGRKLIEVPSVSTYRQRLAVIR